MKLYATTTSERASKGQGGNNLEITIQDKDMDILLRMEVKTKDERTKDNRLKYFTKILDGDIDFLINLKSNIAFYIETEKGKKQKTATIKCKNCGYHDNTHNEHCDNCSESLI